MRLTILVIFASTVLPVPSIVLSVKSSNYRQASSRGEVERSITAKGIFTGVRPTKFRDPSADYNVSTYLPMSRSKASRSMSRFEAFRKGALKNTAPTYLNPGASLYYSNLKIGSRGYSLIVDTGSSDTWVAEKGFQCLDIDSRGQVPENICNFGSVYSPGNEFKHIPNENFNITYGDGQFLTGIFGMINVTLGGITVTQQIAVANEAGWVGDGVTSGMMGFAYPSITFGFNGTDPENDTTASQIPYNPLFTTMYKSGKIPPVFSLALNRPRTNGPSDALPDGYLALGGLPPVATYGAVGKAPIQYVALGNGYLNGSLPWPQYQWYTTTPDAFLYKGSDTTKYAAHQWSPFPTPADSSQVQVMLDSGTTEIWLPTGIAYALAALFEPAATWNGEAFSVSCNATAPFFAIQIGGVVFPVDKRDMILKSDNGTCTTGMNDGMDYPPYVLGDVFMKNVVTVFDVGASEMRFRSRGNY